MAKWIEITSEQHTRYVDVDEIVAWIAGPNEPYGSKLHVKLRGGQWVDCAGDPASVGRLTDYLAEQCQPSATFELAPSTGNGPEKPVRKSKESDRV